MDPTAELLFRAAEELLRRGQGKLADKVLAVSSQPPVASLVATALRTRRRELGLTQKQAAERTTLALATYVSAEQGKHRPTAQTLRLLTRLISLEAIMGNASGLVYSKVAN